MAMGVPRAESCQVQKASCISGQVALVPSLENSVKHTLLALSGRVPLSLCASSSLEVTRRAVALNFESMLIAIRSTTTTKEPMFRLACGLYFIGLLEYIRRLSPLMETV